VIGKERDRTSRAVEPVALDHMFLRGVEVHGHHGVHEWERRDGQLFVVDVDWWLDNRVAAFEDRIESAVCYKQLYDRIVAIVGGGPCALIESLARLLVEDLFAHFPAIVEIGVTVHKPRAALGGAFSDVGVTLTRRRRG
jgi:dihydroneopterin aldolase